MRTPHTMCAAAVSVALIALAACGSSRSSSSSSNSSKEPTKIRVAGPAGPQSELPAARAAAGAAETKASAGAGAASDMALPYRPVRYELQGTLPELDGEAPSWHYESAPQVSTQRIEALAKAFDLSGEVVEQPAEVGGGWRVGPTDGSGPTLYAQADAMASWYYDGSGPVAAKSACIEPAVDEAGRPVAENSSSPDVPAATIPECAPPTPPANVPSAEDARAATLALAERLGAAPAGGKIDVAGDEWGRYTTWSTLIDGLTHPTPWSATYGAEGTLTFANGHLAEPKRAAPYPRIGTTKALELLVASASVDPVALPAVEPAPAPIPADGSVAPATVPACDPAQAAADSPCPPGTTMPVVVVVPITGAAAALYAVYAVDGDVWLVPGYRFLTADGDVIVPAIDASFLEVAPADDGGLRPDAPAGDGSSGSGVEPQPALVPSVAPPGAPVTKD